MTRDQRQRHINKVASTQLSSDPIYNDSSLFLCSASQLAVSAELFQSGLKVPLAVVQGIWQKAEELLCESNCISSAPGHDSKSRMVISRSGKRPHLVTCTKQGKYCCDSDCPNRKSMKLCSHSVAVAQLNGPLQEFCDLYRKAKHVPSVSQLAFAGLPSGVGNKRHQVTRKRKQQPESTCIPLKRASISAAIQPGPSVHTSSSCPRASTVDQPGPSVHTSSSRPRAITVDQPGPSAHTSSSHDRASTDYQPGPSAHTSGSHIEACTSNLLEPCAIGAMITLPGPRTYTPNAHTGASRIRTYTPGSHGRAVDTAVEQPGPSTYTSSPQTNFYPYQCINPQFSQWSTNIHVNRPPWTSPNPSYPIHQSSGSFRLCFRSGNISVCAGCRKRFDKQAVSPNNLCVQHEEWRSYTSPVTNLPESRFGNAYYHAHPNCIMLKWSDFHPFDLEISVDMKNSLTNGHKELLFNLFGIYL